MAANLVDGARIANLRKQRGLDQYELAEKAGVAPSVISRLERNLQADYKLSVIVSVARILGVTVDELLIDTDVEQDMLPEFRAVLDEIRSRDVTTQRLAAGVLRGLLEVSDTI